MVNLRITLRVCLISLPLVALIMSGCWVQKGEKKWAKNTKSADMSAVQFHGDEKTGGDLDETSRSLDADLDVNEQGAEENAEDKYRFNDIFLGLFSALDADHDGVADQSVSLRKDRRLLSMEFMLADKPAIDLFFLLDRSTSMAESLTAVKQNVGTLLTNLSERYTPRVTVMSFYDDSVPVTKFGPSADLAAISQHVSGLTVQAGAGTSVPGLVAINKAIDATELAREEQGGEDRLYVMVLVTDKQGSNAQGTTDTTQTAARFDSLTQQDRVKFFASLGEAATQQYSTLFGGVLTDVVQASRGSLDLAFPLTKQAVVTDIASSITGFIQGSDLDVRCQIQKVSVSPLGGTLVDNTYSFGLDEDNFKIDYPFKGRTRLVGLLKGNDIQALASQSVSVAVERCCKASSEFSYSHKGGDKKGDSSAKISEAKLTGCTSKKQRSITFSFAR